MDGALWGAFSNCGQVCSGVERIYVARPLLEPFVEELARRARSLRIGRGEELDTELGPLISEGARGRVEELVEDAVDRGAEVRVGGGRPDVVLPGWFHEPTILTGVEREARIELEEVFGPVVTAPFGDEAEAVRLANGSSFGLGASVWTRDLDRAAAGAAVGRGWSDERRVHSYSTGQAWGGTKESGSSGARTPSTALQPRG